MFQHSTFKIRTSNSGFTLIELLVVIAIIGILSSIVLAALGSARQRARATAVQSTISQVRAQAELEGDFSVVCNVPGRTTGVTSDTGQLIADALDQGNLSPASSNTDLFCNSNAISYAVSVDLDNSGAADDFCVDSNGYAGPGTAPNRVASLPGAALPVFACQP